MQLGHIGTPFKSVVFTDRSGDSTVPAHYNALLKSRKHCIVQSECLPVCGPLNNRKQVHFMTAPRVSCEQSRAFSGETCFSQPGKPLTIKRDKKCK